MLSVCHCQIDIGRGRAPPSSLLAVLLLSSQQLQCVKGNLTQGASMGDERVMRAGFDEDTAARLADELDRKVPLVPVGAIRDDSARAAALLRAAVGELRLLRDLVNQARADLTAQQGNLRFWAERALAAEALLAKTENHLKTREQVLRSVRPIGDGWDQHLPSTSD